jgi:hypothetical protein
VQIALWALSLTPHSGHRVQPPINEELTRIASGKPDAHRARRPRPSIYAQLHAFHLLAPRAFALPFGGERSAAWSASSRPATRKQSDIPMHAMQKALEARRRKPTDCSAISQLVGQGFQGHGAAAAACTELRCSVDFICVGVRWLEVIGYRRGDE